MTKQINSFKKVSGKILAAVLVLLLFCTLFSARVFAAVAIVQIQVADAKEANGQVIVPVTISGTEAISTYTVVLEYDTSRLSYVSGADHTRGASVILSGTGLSKEISYNIVFDVLSGGKAGIAVGYTSILFAGSDTPVHAKTGETVYLRLSGPDTGDNSFEDRADIADMSAESGMPIIGKISIEGEGNYYLIDQSLYVPEEADWSYKKIQGTFLGRELTFLTDSDENTQIQYMLNEKLDVVCFAINKADDLFKVSEKVDKGGGKCLCVPLNACLHVPEEIKSVPYSEDYIVYGISRNGSGDYYFSDTSGSLTKWEPGMEEELEKAAKQQEQSDTGKDMLVIIIAVVLMIIIFSIFFLVFRKVQENKRRQNRRKRIRSDLGSDDLEDDYEFFDFADMRPEETEPEETEKDVLNPPKGGPGDEKGKTPEEREKDVLEPERPVPETVNPKDWPSEEIRPVPEDTAPIQFIPLETAAEKPFKEETGPARRKPEIAAEPETAVSTAPARPRREVVISVQDVSMKFKVASGNVSGIKDYLIQLVSKKIKRREFTALDHVSFDVYKGDVMGIIGTNGSGKSTMLKIVAGALRPSSGQVEMDQSKIQLLTIGTGFDHELTAKENVYLNGSIIGYSKSFIDEHYDEIVEFAELDGFMDEKVKNFSSGMVSRLGFAIATVGNAAEILILDEVLAVGDEFFRRKSLARVKEMIHSGSTVLIVSHNMNTILDNCDKVVWLEKSRLKMIGDAKIVCRAYQEMGNEKG